MKVLTTISYKKHFELYTEILDLIVVNSCQLGLAKKYILLSDTAVILYRAGSPTAVEDRHIEFTLSTSTYSIDDFNAKVKVAVLQQRQN